MALPAKYNQSVLFGDTLAFQVIYKQPNGTVVNLDGKSIEMEIRGKATDEVEELKLAVGSGITKDAGVSPAGSNGVFDVVLTRAQTMELGMRGRDKRYEYFLKVITSGVHDSILFGEILIKGGYGS